MACIFVLVLPDLAGVSYNERLSDSIIRNEEFLESSFVVSARIKNMREFEIRNTKALYVAKRSKRNIEVGTFHELLQYSTYDRRMELAGGLLTMSFIYKHSSAVCIGMNSTVVPYELV